MFFFRDEVINANFLTHATEFLDLIGQQLCKNGFSEMSNILREKFLTFADIHVPPNLNSSNLFRQRLALKTLSYLSQLKEVRKNNFPLRLSKPKLAIASEI